MPRMLLAIVAILVAIEAIWLSSVHFLIDWIAYGRFAAVAIAFAAGGLFYAKIRNDERLSTMLFGTAFLVAFSNLSSVLNYFLLTVARSRIDEALARIDQSLGVNWPMMIAWAANHPRLNIALYLTYNIVLPEIALLIVLLGWRSPLNKIYSFCFAIVFATIIAVGFWTIFPSFGAIAAYPLDPKLVAHVRLSLDPTYAKELLELLANGPGLISPSELKGLIGFPSFHAVLALLVAWYAKDIKYVRWPVFAINAVVLISTPIQGGHHVIDVVAGFGVATISILAAEKLTAVAARRRTARFDPEFSGAKTPA